MNKLLDELVTIATTERDAYLRFAARKSKGNAQEALEILSSKAE